MCVCVARRSNEVNLLYSSLLKHARDGRRKKRTRGEKQRLGRREKVGRNILLALALCLREREKEPIDASIVSIVLDIRLRLEGRRTDAIETKERQKTRLSSP